MNHIGSNSTCIERKICPYLDQREPVEEFSGLSREYRPEPPINNGRCPVFPICRESSLHPVCYDPSFVCEYMGLVESRIIDGELRLETYYSCEEGELIIGEGSVSVLKEDGCRVPIESAEEFFTIMDGRRMRDRSNRRSNRC